MNKIKNPKFWITLVIFSLIGQVAWVVENMYFNVFIYKMFNASAEAISAMVMASAVAATLTTVFIGALSDKIGKRKLFMCGGYIVWGISIMSFAAIRTDVINALFPSVISAASVGVSLVIIMDCVMTFFGSSANDAAFNAWLTDSTDVTNRGAAEGINSMMPLIAILVVFGGFMGFDLNKSYAWTTIFIVIGAVVLIIGILGIFLIKDSCEKREENNKYFVNIFYGFRPSVIKNNVILYITLICFAVFGISIQIFMPYLILYYNVSLQMDNYVLIMAPAIIIAAVVTAFYGRLYDKKGFAFSIIPSLSLLCLGYIILYLFKGNLLVFVGSLLMMCGYLTGMAVFGAMLRDHTPEGKAGMFQGLRIVGQVLIPGIVGPFIGSLVLKNAEKIKNDDGTFSFIPNENIFLAALVVIAVLVLVLAIEFAAIKRKRSNNE
ncbi:MAG: MFS transporter [Clostridia bacterium]|nr:MFS transporter [Clostridia bacterium]MBO5913102.1 MFS transporter [Clostridia bacterium]